MKRRIDGIRKDFRRIYGRECAVCAFAPGRIEVLGNHTDYNEGYVLSAAIDCGLCFAAAPRTDRKCRAATSARGGVVSWSLDGGIRPSRKSSWTNYIRGMVAGLSARGVIETGFDCLVSGDLPAGAGLSSSAALEMSCGLALAGLYGIAIPRLDLAKIGQAAEHKYAGVKCGLLDQVTSLFGCSGNLVLTDFRSLRIRNIGFATRSPACFLVVNTGVKHALAESDYNERHGSCKRAAAFFRKRLSRPVAALRDVSWADWKRLSPAMPRKPAARSAHVIGENARVLKAAQLLGAGDSVAFGRLMFESHRSSIENFENSCPELDFLVDAAGRIPAVSGARLTGGGFGGSVLVLVDRNLAAATGRQLANAFRRKFGRQCSVNIVRPADGAAVIFQTRKV